MEHSNIYYINVPPYTNSIPFNEMAERYYEHNSNKVFDKSNFIKFVVTKMNKYNFHVQYKSVIDNNSDNEISKEILSHMRNFFKLYKNKQTKKQKNKYNIAKNRTRKST
jgi:predicted small metal-binding protein